MFRVLKPFRKGSQGTADSLSQFAALDFVLIYMMFLGRYGLNATHTVATELLDCLGAWAEQTHVWLQETA